MTSVSRIFLFFYVQLWISVFDFFGRNPNRFLTRSAFFNPKTSSSSLLKLSRSVPQVKILVIGRFFSDCSKWNLVREEGHATKSFGRLCA